jgi:hypothetical protein
MSALRFVTAEQLYELTSFESIGAHQVCGNLLVQTVTEQVMVTQDDWCRYVDRCLKGGSTGNERLYHEERPQGHLGFMPASELVNAGGAQ